MKGRTRKAAAVGGVLLAGCFTAAPLAMALSQTAANLQWAREELLQESRASGSGYGCHPPPGLGRLACLETGKDNVDAVQFVQTITKPEDYLFVGTGRHDKIFANNILFYFLANRRPATKWHHFDPGLQTSAEIQREIITELEVKRPPVVVLRNLIGRCFYLTLIQPDRDGNRASGVYWVKLAPQSARRVGSVQHFGSVQ